MENNKPHNKPDWKELASFMSNIAPDANSTDAFIKGCELVWNTHVVPLQEKLKVSEHLKELADDAIVTLQRENKALKIDASNWAYQCDRAKQDRDKAEFENQALREENQRLRHDINMARESIKTRDNEIEILKQDLNDAYSKIESLLEN